MNPTHKSMVPCPYFLNGKCRFDDDACRFVHSTFSFNQRENTCDLSLYEKYMKARLEWFFLAGNMGW